MKCEYASEYLSLKLREALGLPAERRSNCTLLHTEGAPGA